MTYFFLFLAGILIAFSPCILPVLPIIIASALQRNRLGPLLLIIGLILGFVSMGTLFQILIQAFNISPSLLPLIAAYILILLGCFLVISPFKKIGQRLLQPLANVAERLNQTSAGMGMFGQLLIGALLGVLWSPCIGPALGAAITLAASATYLYQAALMMFVFALGTAIPLLIISYGSQLALARFSMITSITMPILGIMFIGLGLAILLGWQQLAQAYLLQQLPSWWLHAITLF